MISYTAPIIMAVIFVCLAGAMSTAYLAMQGRMDQKYATVIIVMYSLLAGINIAMLFNQHTLDKAISEIQNGQ